MAIDTEGNNLDAVGIPVTGFAAVQLDGTQAFVDADKGNVTPLELPTGYKKVGLYKVDGGPQDASDKEDDIEFFQDGYKMGGAQTRTLQINLAQFDEFVRELISGQTPDANGMIIVDSDRDSSFPMFEVVKYKNGWSRRRNGLARIQTVEPDQNTRGEVFGNAVTFEWVRNETIGGLYREWLVPPAGYTPPAPEQP